MASQTLFERWSKHGGPGKIPKGQLDKKTLV